MNDEALRACLDLRWRPGGPTVREQLLRSAREAYDNMKGDTTMETTIRKPLLRAPGQPRAEEEPTIPGFGVCGHPEHGTVVWLVEGEVVNGQPVGRCDRHSSRIAGIDG